MATKGTEELPQSHENAAPQSSANELSPDTGCRAPPNGVGLHTLDRHVAWIVPPGSSERIDDHTPGAAPLPVVESRRALTGHTSTHVVLGEVSGRRGAEQVAETVTCSLRSIGNSRSFFGDRRGLSGQRSAAECVPLA